MLLSIIFEHSDIAQAHLSNVHSQIMLMVQHHFLSIQRRTSVNALDVESDDQPLTSSCTWNDVTSLLLSINLNLLYNM